MWTILLGQPGSRESTMTRPHKTLYLAFLDTALKHPDKPALMHKARGGKYESITYRDLDGLVIALATELTRLGIGKGDRIAIFAYHGPGWVMADLAAARAGAIVVPLFHTLAAASARHILGLSGCKLAFVENKRLLSKVEQIRSDLPALKNIVVFDPEGVDAGKDLWSFDDIISAGGDAVRNAAVPDWPSLSADDTATIIFTSGTTGNPKGVKLSHRNILTTACAAIERFRLSSADIFLSFLPVSHVFEKTCGFYAMLLAGVTIAYAQDLSTIAKDIREIRPTIILVVPRIIRGAYEAVQRKLLKAPALQRVLVRRGTLVLAKYSSLRRRGKRIPLGLRLRYYFYDRAVAARFRKIAGGRIRAIVSGGAPLERRLSEIVIAMGLNIVEGYGLTEAAPLVSANTVEDNAIGTVGKPFEHLDVRIGENCEILVRGPNVMKGYYNDPEATARAIDAEGWLHTGDQGRLDAGGHLVITGRLKELIVTSHGKNVAQLPIERRINSSRYIRQSMLCGDNQKSITALIVPEKVAVEQFARRCGLPARAYRDLLATREVRDLIAGQIEQATPHLADYERITRFTLLPEPFTIDNELLTPTLKLRRARIADRYTDEIASMYE